MDNTFGNGELPDNWQDLEGLKGKTEDEAKEIIRSIEILAELTYMLYVEKKQEEEKTGKVIDLTDKPNQNRKAA